MRGADPKEDDKRSTRSIAGGFKERRFQLKMDKLRKLYEKQRSSELNSLVSGISKYSRANTTTEQDSEELGAMLKDENEPMESLMICKLLIEVTPERKKKELMSAQSSNTGTVQSEFKRNMQTSSLGTSESASHLDYKSRDGRQIHFASQPSIHSAVPSRKQSAGMRCDFDIDIKKETESSDDEDSTIKTETFEPNSSESSFNPNLIEYSHVSSKVQVKKRNAIRLRDFKQYNKKCVILPDDPWKRKWNWFLLICILVSSITTPLRVAFFDTKDLFWEITQFFFDIVFVIDIVFSFFSAYYNNMEALNTNKRQIAINYLKSWFLIDFIAVIPLSLFTNSTLNSLGNLARFPRIYKIAKTSKFIRAMKVAKVKTKIKKEITKISRNNIEFERILTYFFIFIVLCHNMACFWFLLAKFQDFNQHTWVMRYDYMDSTVPEQYIAALYFIVTTITTVGFGDISSKTPAEQSFSVILMIIGVISFSMAISSFTSMITVQNQKQERLRQKLKVLTQLRAEYKINFELYWRLRQSLHYEHSMDMSDQQNFISELPSKLRVQISNIMYTQELGDINYFNHKSPQFIASVAPLLKPIKVQKGEYVFLKGDSIDGIYFIKKGEAAYVQKRPHADLIFGKIFEGAYFGDVDFTASNESEEAKRLFTMKAQTDLDLLFLEKESLLQVDADYKKEIFQLFHKSHAQLAKLNNMNRRSSVWLQKKYQPLEHKDAESLRREILAFANNSNRQDGSNQYSEKKESECSVSDKLPLPKRKGKGPPLRRAVTIHKPTKIGSILAETMGSIFESEDAKSDKGIKEKKKSKKKLKTMAKYEPTIIKVSPAEVIEEVDQNYESGNTLASPTLNPKSIRRASRFTIPENFEQEDSEDEDQEIQSSFSSSMLNDMRSEANRRSSLEKAFLKR